MLTVITSTEWDQPKNLSGLSFLLEQMQIIFNCASLYVGMKGYTGIVLQSQSNIRYLLVYLLLYVTFTVVRLLRLDVLCEDFKDVKEVKCSDIRTVYVTLCAIEFMTYGYFSFVAWSYLKKLENSPDLPRFGFEDNPLFMASVPAGSRNAGVAYRLPLNQQEMTSAAEGAQQPQVAAPRITPFSGQAHRLE